MNQPYLAFLLLLGFVAFNAALLIGLSHLLAPHKPTALKASPYESGMPPLGNARERFSVKFYLVAMLFIIFDIETVFLIPWGTIYFGGAAGAAGGGGGPGPGLLLVPNRVFMFHPPAGSVSVRSGRALDRDR